MLGFIIPLLTYPLAIMGVQWCSSTLRFPLGLPGEFAVDSKGNIYCTSSPYDRLQIYDKDGKFVRGWFVPLRTGGNRVILDSKGNIHVRTQHQNEEYAVFTIEGEFLKKYKKNSREEDTSYFVEAQDNAGNVYKVRSPWVFPKIVRIAPSGEENVVVSDPIHLWFIKSPIPSAAAIFGISIAYSIRKFFKKKSKATEKVVPTT